MMIRRKGERSWKRVQFVYPCSTKSIVMKAFWVNSLPEPIFCFFAEVGRFSLKSFPGFEI